MFDIVKNRKIFYIVSLIVILAGVVALFVRGGFTSSIDFAGGVECTVETGKAVDQTASANISDIVAESTGIDKKAISVTKIGDAGTQASIKLSATLTSEQILALKDALVSELGVSKEAITDFESVSASVGKETQSSAILAVVIAVVLMLIYITIRFEFLSGCAAVCALVHDVLVMLSAYAILGLPINTSFIAAMLTIIGYSINATIVQFDRVRENTKLTRKGNFAAIVNKSVWQTMFRSLNTTFTTLVVILVLYIMGVQSIREFALPIMLGLIAGTWSSVFLSGNFWVFFKKLSGAKNVMPNEQ
ncbi:MAG: protein translocase subunit SecF [Clostridia bacterium]|nr:protein translocase subunit SecF [Clostridia bacterium]